MNCPNCDKRPVGVLPSFRFNGVNLKEKAAGYFRCRHCDTLLRQPKGEGPLPKYQEGFWVRYILSTIVVFGVFLGWIFWMDRWDFGDWTNMSVFIVLIGGYLLLLEEVRTHYWVIKEADKGEHLKEFARMGGLGWFLLITFLVVMVGGLIAIDLYVDMSILGQWQQILALIFYVVAIIGGALGIFSYFSDTEGEEGVSDELSSNSVEG
ncbi:hypothetical protein [Fodinibius saliphilus]|uniref:hypothetical protein n=1 Tax=Fodinibius saliphilus TaxID=1920650 RepID=UPI001109248E|nr:hypothetical protein [Fodinibius saliphilus]